MPQLSLYLDSETMSVVQQNAALESSSISKYVTKLIKQHTDSGWPEGYWSLFGSVADGAFTRPAQISLSKDAKREVL
jgi:hypothetical protein